MNVNERSQYLAGVHPAERFVTFFLLKRMTNIDRARSRGVRDAHVRGRTRAAAYARALAFAFALARSHAGYIDCSR